MKSRSNEWGIRNEKADKSKSAGKKDIRQGD